MKISNLHQAEIVMGKLVPNKVERAYKLSRMRQLMGVLGNPQETLKVVHVAGTAGKTSTSYFIAKMLQLSGQKVGLTISPHLIAINERVQLDGRPLPEAEFCDLLQEFLEIDGVLETQPTYFEMLVAFAFWVFAREKVDYAVVEVGLGGLVDATNVVTRPDKLCVITDISFDHVHILGDTLEKIATHKAGIIQPGNAVFILDQPDEVTGAIYQYAKQQDARLFIHQESPQVPDGLPVYQKRNWSLAHDAYTYLANRDRFKPLTLSDTSDWSVPGRMERVGNFILDGAHNPSKFSALVTSLGQQFPQRKLTCIIGMNQTKQTYAHECARILAPIADKVIIVAGLPFKSVDSEYLAKQCREVGIVEVLIAQNLVEAMQKAPKSSPVVITGSLYLLGPAKEVLLKL